MSDPRASANGVPAGVPAGAAPADGVLRRLRPPAVPFPAPWPSLRREADDPIIDSVDKGKGAANTLSPYPLAQTRGLALPVRFDKWRQEGFLLPPTDQAKCGSCYAHAAVGQLADRLSIATNKRIQHALSVQYVLSCLQSEFEFGCGGTLDVPPIYAALMPGGMLGGTYRQHIFPYSGQQWDPAPDPDPKSPCHYTPDTKQCQADDVGSPSDRNELNLPEACYPPQAHRGMRCTGTVPCDVAYIRRWYPDAAKYSFARVEHLSENTNAGVLFPGRDDMAHYQLSVPVSMTPAQLERNIVRIKESIFLRGPVTAVLPIYDDFDATFRLRGAAWDDPDFVYEVSPAADNEATSLHHVLLVGWGSRPGPDGRPLEHWIVKNSWGVWWNYDGYFNARMRDPRLLIESNCHSAIPLNPETGRAAEPFDHSGEGALPASHAAALLALALLFVALVFVALRLASGSASGGGFAPWRRKTDGI